MLDRVTSIEPASKGEGLKAVSAADCPVPEGSPTSPSLPGPLVLQGLCALAEMVLEKDGARRAVLEAAEEATFARAARPGEVLTYTVTVEDSSKEAAILRAEATVQGETAVVARLRFRFDETAADPLEAAWRGLRRMVLSGETPPIIS